jgi:hypothetical protein
MPADDHLGIVYESPIDEWAPSYDHHREAIIMMAGRIAESIYKKEEIKFSGCMTDAVDYCFGVYGEGETLDAFLTYVFHYTQDLVKKWWPEIEALAEELLEKKEIGYLKAIKLIRETHERRLWGDRYEEEKAWERDLKAGLRLIGSKKSGKAAP